MSTSLFHTMHGDSLSFLDISNRLSVNPSKTEYLFFGNSQQCAKVSSATVAFCGNTLTPTNSCRNLGVVFDRDISFQKHISSICSSSFYHIRYLRQIRSCLDINSAVILANALVSSSNSTITILFLIIFLLVWASTLNRLQIVQNSLARVVVPSVKEREHIPRLFVSYIGFLSNYVLKIKLLLLFLTLYMQFIPIFLIFLFPMLLQRNLRSFD